jgi:glycosyltransferase involved in cell wall biosynthesis
MLALTFPRRWLSARATLNVTPSRAVATLLGLPRTRVVLHGVDARLADEAPRAAVSPPVIAYLGRLTTSKGPHVLLAAVRELVDRGVALRLRVLGDGPERSRLERQVQSTSLEGVVELLGTVPPEAQRAALRDATIVVMPSLFFETFGLVAAEAMMRGRLVVVSAAGALPEVVDDCGLVVPPGDVKALADCLEHALATPALVAERAARGKKRALALFRDERMMAEHESICHEVGHPR